MKKVLIFIIFVMFPIGTEAAKQNAAMPPIHQDTKKTIPQIENQKMTLAVDKNVQGKDCQI